MVVSAENNLHGPRKRSYAKDTLASGESIRDGSLHGVTRKWYTNGKLSQVVSYEQGMANGTARSWHDDGSIKAWAIMDRDQIVKQNFWDLGERFEWPEEVSSEATVSP